MVNAELEKVYAAYVDFEAMPHWSRHLKSVRVTGRDGDTVHLESEVISSEGDERTRVGKLRLFPSEKVVSESETRFTRSIRTVVFEHMPDIRTRVTAILDVQVKGLWSLVLRPGVRKEDAEASALEELDSFARFVETRSGR